MSESNGHDPRWDFFCRGTQATLENAGPRRLSALKTLEATLAKEKRRLHEERNKIFIAMPAYSKTGNWDEAWHGFLVTPTDQENFDIIQSKFTNSLLARSFNHLYAQALFLRKKEGVTHLVMIHTDIAVEGGWVDKLWEESCIHQADIVSVVMPIKSPLGLTVVALDEPDIWLPRRLTMTEIMQLPETFDTQATIDAGLNPHGSPLLVGTGCWICDLRKSWVDAVDENGWLKCYFTIHDGIRKDSDSYFVGVQPEDWTFSRMVRKVAPEAKILATRKVVLKHMGETGYPNNGVWGQWETDQDALAVKAAEETTEIESVNSEEELLTV